MSILGKKRAVLEVADEHVRRPHAAAWWRRRCCRSLNNRPVSRPKCWFGTGLISEVRSQFRSRPHSQSRPQSWSRYQSSSQSLSQDQTFGSVLKVRIFVSSSTWRPKYRSRVVSEPKYWSSQSWPRRFCLDLSLGLENLVSDLMSAARVPSR